MQKPHFKKKNTFVNFFLFEKIQVTAFAYVGYHRS